ncbi:MAG: hydrogenase formation protein HypD [Cyanobacteriota bacterium]|nr:hydrogenase formation protein HypD [Cyanobacteriota bacterium]
MTTDPQTCLAALHAGVSQPWTLMEVCGGQTHSILRWGIDQLLPPRIALLHGPGCPVCVTPADTLDQALQLAALPEVILASYGDMLRVPGSDLQASDAAHDLLQARAAGADVRLLTSPLQALDLARRHPQRQVVVLAVGFETTAPATALLVEQIERLGLANVSLLHSHVRVVPAMEAIAAAPGQRVQGFLAAGHVATVMGYGELERLVQAQRLPVVITGFGAQELLQGVSALVRLLEAGTPRLLNAYAQVVRPAGNPAAQALLRRVFAPADGVWRGLGLIAGGVLALRPAHRHLDARQRFGLREPSAEATGERCIADQVLQGRCRPPACPSFGSACTPQHPLGAPMVSSEGACAAYFQYRGCAATPA